MDLLKEGDYLKIITKEGMVYYGFAYNFRINCKEVLFFKGTPLQFLLENNKIIKTKCKFQKHKFYLFKKILQNENRRISKSA